MMTAAFPSTRPDVFGRLGSSNRRHSVDAITLGARDDLYELSGYIAIYHPGKTKPYEVVNNTDSFSMAFDDQYDLFVADNPGGLRESWKAPEGCVRARFPTRHPDDVSNRRPRYALRPRLWTALGSTAERTPAEFALYRQYDVCVEIACNRCGACMLYVCRCGRRGDP